MELPAPTSLAEVIADGAILAADISAGMQATLGPVSRVELTRGRDETGADLVQVDLIRPRARAVSLPGTVVAEIHGDSWTWLDQRGAAFGIPELQGTLPAAESLIQAARTLAGGAPVLLAPDAAGRTWVVALQGDFPRAAPRQALITGLAALPEGTDVERALLGFAAARGLGVRRLGRQLHFSDGTSLTLIDGRVTDLSGGLTLAQVRADAHYLSAEHQLFFEGVLPRATTSLDQSFNRVAVSSPQGGQLTAAAVVIATVDQGTWTWAWADPRLPVSPARELRRFGIEQGIPELFTARVRLERARELALWTVAKPVLHHWTHTTLALDGGYAMVLLDAPELTLPAPGEAAVQATLATALPADLDRDRALRAYAGARGLVLEQGRIRI